MRKLTIIFALLIALTAVGETFSKRPKRGKRYQKTHRMARLKKIRKAKVVKKIVPIDPRLDDPNYDPFLQCEDTCDHVHGIDLSRTRRWRMYI